MARAAVRRRLSWQAAEVLALQPETPRATRISLRPPEWTGHLPGQHVDVRLTAPDGYVAQRSYSLASGPEDPVVQLVVERLADGEVSPYLTEQLRAGDLLELRGPVGGYFLWPTGSDAPVQLVAGGSGVVPFLSMLRHRRATASTVPVRLLYSARTADDLIGRADLEQPGPAAEVTTTLTRGAPPGWPGLVGRVHRELLAQLVLPPDREPHVLVCGPTAFVESVAAGLVDLGHPPERIRTERFGASGAAT